MSNLATKLAYLSRPLTPFVSLSTGDLYLKFPKTLLSFWSLTESELDDLAFFYQQTKFCKV